MEEKPVVIILHGDDLFAMQQYVNGLFARMGDPGLADLNTTRLDGRGASEEDLRTAATSIPFLAERRLVVLTNPKARMTNAAASKRFLALLDSLPPTTALVLVQEDEQRWDRNARQMAWGELPETHVLMQWVRQAGKRASVREFSLPRAAEMPGWIIKRAREHGGVFTTQAAQALANLVGSDTQVATQEIDKLLLYVDRARPVEEEDVAECTADITTVNVFDMIDALAAGETSAALRLLSGLMEEKEPMMLFGAIVSHFRGLLLAREALAEGGGSAQVMKLLPRRPQKVIEKMCAQAMRFSLPALDDVYRRLARMDQEMKTGVLPPDLALQLFVAEVGS
jgi:DNA polymerase-3 subunit delta